DGAWGEGDDGRAMSGGEQDGAAGQPARGENLCQRAPHRMTDQKGFLAKQQDFALKVGGVIGEAGAAKSRVGRVARLDAVVAQRWDDDAVAARLKEMPE